MDLPASIAVTGADGFIGSHLVERLHRVGVEPICLTRSQGYDICDPRSLERSPHFDAMVHLAARTFVPAARADANPFLATNITGTLNVLQACRQHQAGIVFPSSYVYGRPNVMPIDESHPTGHWNPYASSKLVGEALCRSFAECFDVPAVVLRLFNVYGPRQSCNFLIPKILAGAKAGEISLQSSKPRRDFVHVADVTDAIVRSLAHLRASNYDSLTTFNVGSGVSHSVQEVVNFIVNARKHHSPVTVHFSEQERPNEVMDVVADYGHIHRTLGWQPTIDLQTGLTQLALSNE